MKGKRNYFTARELRKATTHYSPYIEIYVKEGTPSIINHMNKHTLLPAPLIVLGVLGKFKLQRTSGSKHNGHFVHHVH